MTAHTIKCTCCGDDTDEAKAYTDPDLRTPVCEECKLALRWAQARLKEANIVAPPREP
jgi:hypothetical protein